MLVCLIPLKTEARKPSANLACLAQRLAEIAPYQPDLVCLPECALTGYLYDEGDFKQFAESIPGPATEQIGQFARTYATFISFGLIERAQSGVYNTAVLIDRTGKVILKYRKIEEKPPFIKGEVINSVDTELGRLGLLICGDLFNTEVVHKLDPLLSLLIMPMARSFDKYSPDFGRWVSEERQVYIEAVKAAGVTTLIVNALEINTSNPSFGGAMIVNAGGELLAESPHGTDNVLVWEFE